MLIENNAQHQRKQQMTLYEGQKSLKKKSKFHPKMWFRI